MVKGSDQNDFHLERRVKGGVPIGHFFEAGRYKGNDKSVELSFFIRYPKRVGGRKEHRESPTPFLWPVYSWRGKGSSNPWRKVLAEAR
jgi:hypothetical protein